MKTRVSSRLVASFALWLLAFLFYTGSVRAATQTNILTEGVVTSGWAVVYNDAEVSGPTFLGNTNWNRIGGSQTLMGS